MSDDELELYACAHAYRTAGREWRNLLAPGFIRPEDGPSPNISLDDLRDVCEQANEFFDSIEGMLVLPVPDP